MPSSTMSPDPPTIVCAGFDWRHPSPMRHLELALARDHRLIHVESLALRRPTLGAADCRRMAFKLGRLVGVVPPGGPVPPGPPGALQVIAPALPAIGPAPLRALAAQTTLVRVRAALRDWGVARPWLFVTALPSALPLARALGARVNAYYRVDDWAQWPGIDPAGIPALERALMHRVDLTFCTSTALLEDAWCRRGAARHLPQGVDGRHFAGALEPGPTLAAVAGLPRPVLGFFGTLDDRLDPRLLGVLQQWRGSVVLAGPRMPAAPEIPGRGAIRWIGPVEYAQLPALARGVDAWVLPYVVSERTAAIDPLKLREYLATGRPVVSTPLPDVLPWRDHVWIAADADAFLAAVRQATRAPDAGRAARLAALEGHSWDDRRTTFLDAVRGVCSPPATPPPPSR